MSVSLVSARSVTPKERWLKRVPLVYKSNRIAIGVLYLFSILTKKSFKRVFLHNYLLIIRIIRYILPANFVNLKDANIFETNLLFKSQIWNIKSFFLAISVHLR